MATKKAPAKPASKAKASKVTESKEVKAVKPAKTKSSTIKGVKTAKPAKAKSVATKAKLEAREIAPKPIKVHKEVVEPENAALGATKIEKTILEAIRTAKLGLPDWPSIAKTEHVSLDYLNNRVDWMRRMGMII